jgi:cytochrome c biogenesis protein CcmG, thiol:disulfide interchange protein DsbE
MKRVLITSIVVLFAGVLLFAVSRGAAQSDGRGTTVGGSPTVADQAPTFSAKTLAGTPVSLESYRGKPLVLIFWASW